MKSIIWISFYINRTILLDRYCDLVSLFLYTGWKLESLEYDIKPLLDTDIWSFTLETIHTISSCSIHLIVQVFQFSYLRYVLFQSMDQSKFPIYVTFYFNVCSNFQFTLRSISNFDRKSNLRYVLFQSIIKISNLRYVLFQSLLKNPIYVTFCFNLSSKFPIYVTFYFNLWWKIQFTLRSVSIFDRKSNLRYVLFQSGINFPIYVTFYFNLWWKIQFTLRSISMYHQNFQFTLRSISIFREKANLRYVLFQSFIQNPIYVTFCFNLSSKIQFTLRSISIGNQNFQFTLRSISIIHSKSNLRYVLFQSLVKNLIYVTFYFDCDPIYVTLLSIYVTFYFALVNPERRSFHYPSWKSYNSSNTLNESFKFSFFTLPIDRVSSTFYFISNQSFFKIPGQSAQLFTSWMNGWMDWCLSLSFIVYNESP